MVDKKDYIADKFQMPERREPGWVPPQLKKIPQIHSRGSVFHPEKFKQAIIDSIRLENERFKAQLPANIVAEYALGESDLVDNINLTDAAYVTQPRHPTG